MDHEAATAVGIHVGRSNAIAFMLGAALAALAGGLVGPLLYVSPAMGGSARHQGLRRRDPRRVRQHSRRHRRRPRDRCPRRLRRRALPGLLGAGHVPRLHRDHHGPSNGHLRRADGEPRMSYRLRLRLAGIAALGVAAWCLPYQLDSYTHPRGQRDHPVRDPRHRPRPGHGHRRADQPGPGGVLRRRRLRHRDPDHNGPGSGFWVAAGLAMLIAAAIGLLIGTPALRMQSHYLGIVTLGLALALHQLGHQRPHRRRGRGHHRHPGAAVARASTCATTTSTTTSSSSCSRSRSPSACSSCTRRWAARCAPCATTRSPPARSGWRSRMLRMTAFFLSSVYGGSRRRPLRGADPLRGAGDLQHRPTCSCCSPW